MIGTPDPLEKSLQDAQKAESQRMTDEFKKDMNKPDQQVSETSSESNWWKWALGAVVVGGVAVAAGGGKGGSGSSSGSGGTVVSTW